ncbi:hypothetical protein [Chlamydia sp. No. 12]|uniref:Uncharacterized protein n=1 Tax=Chlamydia crocodili TaxID=2766982 RepID=A0ABX8CIA7_9CHLA|nr:hypothetical protein H9Q19_00380 [Chlamydia crocodili]
MKSVRFLYDSERSDEGRDLGRIINSTSNYIHEDNEEIDSFMALTWEEWSEIVRKIVGILTGAIDFLNKIEREEGFPYYTINRTKRGRGIN